MTRRAKIISGVVVLFVVFVSTPVLVLDMVVKHGVEHYGSLMTKSAVTLRTARISLISGRGEIENLEVDNPPEFKSGFAIKIPAASVQVQTATILSRKIVIHTLVAKDSELILEEGIQGSNLNAISGNVDTYVTDPNAAAGSGMRLEVDELTLTGTHVKVALTELSGKGAAVNIPDIHMTNLGTDPEGITPAELVQKILDQVINNATNTAQLGVTKFGNTARDKVKTFGDKFGDRLGKLGKMFGN